MHTRRRATALWLVGILLLVSVSASAQTAITSTTTSAAMARTATAIALTSDTGVTANTALYVDGELMIALTEQGTSSRWNVRRGQADGMVPAVAHASGAQVWIGASSAAGKSFYTYDVAPGSTCAVADYPFTPFINTRLNHVFGCVGSVWVEYDNGGACAVTQITNRATGVTCQGLRGVITTINTSLAAEASAVFVVTNAAVAVGDTVLVTIRSGMVALNTRATVTTVAAGSFSITIVNGNVAAGTAETGAIIINFVVLKGGYA